MNEAERRRRTEMLLDAFRAAGAQDVESADVDCVRIIAKYSFHLTDAGAWTISKWTPSGDGWEAKSLGEWTDELLDRIQALGQ